MGEKKEREMAHREKSMDCFLKCHTDQSREKDFRGFCEKERISLEWDSATDECVENLENSLLAGNTLAS